MRALLLPVLVGLPLAAQTTISTEQWLNAPLLRGLRNSSRPHLLVIEDASRPIMASVRKLLQEDDIADFSFVLRSFPISKESNEGSWAFYNPRADAVQRHFNLGPEILWAVVDSSERCLASGQDIPSAAELARQLTAAGVQGPMRVLRNFLRTHPDHLEARMDLLRLQQESAEQRTKVALNIELGATDNFLMSEVMSERLSASIFNADQMGIVRNAYDRPKPEPTLKDKVLETALDMRIWGGYAESFDRLLSGDDWIAAGLYFDPSDYTLEVCSPLVKGVYRRKIGQVEAALERDPLNYRLWSVWIRMADAIGGRSIMAVADRALRPYAGFSSWPRIMISSLIEDARANSGWGFLADSLWPEYEKRLRTGSVASSATVNYNNGSNYFDDGDDVRRYKDSSFSQQWDSFFEPLLEALINMNDLGKADSIMNALQEEQKQGRWSETQMRKAIALANRCNRPDIARRWSVYVTENNN